MPGEILAFPFYANRSLQVSFHGVLIARRDTGCIPPTRYARLRPSRGAQSDLTAEPLPDLHAPNGLRHALSTHPARLGAPGAAALLRRPGELSAAGAGRGALRRDSARDAGAAGFRHAAAERGALFREAAALLLAQRGGALSAGAARGGLPDLQRPLRPGRGGARLAARPLHRWGAGRADGGDRPRQLAALGRPVAGQHHRRGAGLLSQCHPDLLLAGAGEGERGTRGAAPLVRHVRRRGARHAHQGADRLPHPRRGDLPLPPVRPAVAAAVAGALDRRNRAVPGHRGALARAGGAPEPRFPLVLLRPRALAALHHLGGETAGAGLVLL